MAVGQKLQDMVFRGRGVPIRTIVNCRGRSVGHAPQTHLRTLSLLNMLHPSSTSTAWQALFYMSTIIGIPHDIGHSVREKINRQSWFRLIEWWREQASRHSYVTFLTGCNEIAFIEYFISFSLSVHYTFQSLSSSFSVQPSPSITWSLFHIGTR